MAAVAAAAAGGIIASSKELWDDDAEEEEAEVWVLERGRGRGREKASVVDGGVGVGCGAVRVMYDPIGKQCMDRNTNFGLRRNPAVICLQGLLVLVALLITLVGCCLVGSGIFIYQSERFDRPLLTHLTIAAIALGTGSVVTGILGCVAVFTKRNVLHVTFIVSAACVLLAVLVVGCWLLLQRNTLFDDTTSSLRIAIESYFDDEKSKQFMNEVQNRLECCGADEGYGDYGHHSEEQDMTGVCQMQFYGTPCRDLLAEYLSQKFMLVVGLSAGSGFLLMIALVIVFVQFLVMFCIGFRTNVAETT